MDRQYAGLRWGHGERVLTAALLTDVLSSLQEQ